MTDPDLPARLAIAFTAEGRAKAAKLIKERQMSSRKQLWSIGVKSESGDDFGSHIFNHNPTDDEIEAFLRDLSPCDWPDDGDQTQDCDGPGFRGSYLHVDGPHLQSVRSRRR